MDCTLELFWPSREGSPPEKELRKRRKDIPDRNGPTRILPSQDSAALELHLDPIKNVKLFLRGSLAKLSEDDSEEHYTRGRAALTCRFHRA